tara:strand:- start:152 stop:505 length:354 start_codon:yes stop_codon:yes gene_type:complete
MPRLIEGSRFTTIGGVAGSGASTVYTVPDNYSAIIRHLSFSNNNAAAKKVSAQYYNSATTTYYYIVQDLSVAANAVTNILDGNFITLNSGDKIIIAGETAGTINALVSLEEYYDPNR